MALRHIDSFDHYTTIDSKFTGHTGGISIQTTSGRFGKGLEAGGGDNSAFVTLNSNEDTLIAGVAWRYRGAIWGDLFPILAFKDAGTVQIDVRPRNTGRLAVTRNGTVLATGTTVLSLNVWYYIELKATIGNAGSYELRINEVTELLDASEDTQETSNAFANQVGLSIAGGSTPISDWDDFYICDDTGGANNDFLGDVRIEALFPNGNGNSSQLDGSDGNTTDNYLLVDEATPNDDTDYVESSTVGNKDTYAYTNLTPTSGTVYGVQIQPWARKTDAGARSIAGIARLSGTEVDSSDFVLSSSYQYFRDVRETKPGGGSWSISDVNSSEFGVKVTV